MRLTMYFAILVLSTLTLFTVSFYRLVFTVNANVKFTLMPNDRIEFKIECSKIMVEGNS